MEKRNETVIKLAQTALMAALCFVSFTFLQIKIPLPGGDATSLHIGNAFCVLGALILGGWYGGLAGAGGPTPLLPAVPQPGPDFGRGGPGDCAGV